MTNPIPAGEEGIIPHLVVGDASAAIEFYKNAFGAEELCRMPGPDGRLMHAQVSIDGKTVYLCDDHPEMCGGVSRDPLKLGGGSPVTIHQYTTDVDGAVARAEQAGATVTMPAADMFWGDRYGVVTDPFGHSWSFATHLRDMTPEEIAEAGAAAFG